MQSKAATRLGLFALAIALVLVPTMARARQQVEHRDATRLSIKHNWLGVAPPSKATVTPLPIVVLPPIAIAPEPQPAIQRAPVADPRAPRPALDRSPDPLRGPPAAV